MKIIDPHLHLFALELGHYRWLKADNPPFWPDKQCINKSFNEADLLLTEPLSLAGFIHIEAGFDNEKPWRELEVLEKTCNKPFRSIANIDLTISSNDFTTILDKLAERPSFVGIRHLLDEQAFQLLKNKQVLNNIQVLNSKGLLFEVQLSLTDQEAIDALCDVVANNTNMSFIINHAGFPPINLNSIEWQRWQNNLVTLSSYPHIAIKCSGWEMIDRQYQATWLNKNLSFILSTFSSARVMLASNFPLCLFSHSNYQAYWQSIISSHFFQALSKQEKSALCYDNALSWYSINKIT